MSIQKVEFVHYFFIYTLLYVDFFHHLTYNKVTLNKRVICMPISENIKMIRERYNLSQKELAEIAGVSDKAVSTWENGSKKPRMGAIQKIADYCGLKKSNIIEDDGLNYMFTAQTIPSVSASQKELDSYFNSLNDIGQRKALDYIADLADNPKYQMEVREPDSFYVPEVLAASRPNKEMTDVDKEDLQNVLKLVAKEKQNGQK